MVRFTHTQGQAALRSYAVGLAGPTHVSHDHHAGRGTGRLTPRSRSAPGAAALVTVASPCTAARLPDAGRRAPAGTGDSAVLTAMVRRLPKARPATTTSAVKKGSCTAGSPSARTLRSWIYALARYGSQAKRSGRREACATGICGMPVPTPWAPHTPPVKPRTQAGDHPHGRVRRVPVAPAGTDRMAAGPAITPPAPCAPRHPEHSRLLWEAGPASAFHKFTKWRVVRLPRGFSAWFGTAGRC